MNFKTISLSLIAVSAIAFTVFSDHNIQLIDSNKLEAPSNQAHTGVNQAINSNPNPMLTPAPSMAKGTLKNSTQDHRQSPIDRIKSITDKTDLQKNIIQEHDNFKRYPPENRAIESADHDPITQRYNTDERTTLNEDQSMGLTIWSNEKFYLENDTVTLFAVLQDEEGTKQSTQLDAMFYYQQSQSLGKIEFNDTNNDGIYQASIQLTPSVTLGKGPGVYSVLVQDKKNKITDAVVFTLSQPDIQLTGNYKESIDAKGNLIIDAEVAISANSHFYIQASLYSSTHVAIGTTQLSQQLSKGTHWLPLSFSGLMIQDSNESGPYVLKQVSVAKVTMPMQRGPLVQPNFETDAYALNEFGG